MNNEMKNMASRLGLDYPQDATEHEQLAAIANQVGMPDYYYNSSDNSKLYNTLSDMCGDAGIPSNVAGTDYDPNTEPDYMSDEYQKEHGKNKENGEGEEGDNPEHEGEEEENSEVQNENGETHTDTGDDTVNPYDPNNPNNPNVNPNDPNHPGQEGPGYNPNGNPDNPDQAGNGANGQNGVAPPNQHLDQRDADEHDPGEPGSNGYGATPYQSGSSSSSTQTSNSSTNGKTTSNVTNQQNLPANTNPGQGQRPGNGINKNDNGGLGKPGQKPGQQGGNGGNNGSSGNSGGTNGGPKPAGNGYGALRNRNNGSSRAGGNGSDPTANSRRNFNHNNRTKNGENDGGKPKGKPSASDNNEKKSSGMMGGLGAKVKKGLSNSLGIGRKQDRSVGDDGDGPSSAGERATSKANEKAKKALLLFIRTHPMICLIILLIFFLFFLVFFVIVGDGAAVKRKNNTNTGANKSCNYSLNGVLTTGTVDLNSVQVELVNCDAKKDNYTVLETIDFEKYVIGVALAEVSWHKDYPAYFQAQIVAARGFALKRNSSMCPSHPDNCFYGYNPETGKIRLRACTNDQVYCDPDKTCMKYPRSGKPTLYGPEAEKMSGAKVWKNKLSDTTKAEIMAAADEVKGKVLVDSEGNVVYTNFVNTDQKQWWEYAKQGMNYEQILTTHYASKGASGMSTSDCSYSGIDYGDYSLSSDGDEILHEPLDEFLKKQGTSLEEFNNLIASNVDKAGYGTRQGVVAAALTLIGELGDKYNKKIPYFWGGGHGDGVVVGALAKWGSSKCHTYKNGQSYNYCGLDCSGFVPWAIKNGGFNRGQGLASNFYKSNGAKKVTLNANSAVLQPGDLLESSHHVILVVGIDDSKKEYICAEAMGNAYGVTFSRRSFAPSGYWGVDLTDYYSNQGNVRSK